MAPPNGLGSSPPRSRRAWRGSGSPALSVHRPHSLKRALRPIDEPRTNDGVRRERPRTGIAGEAIRPPDRRDRLHRWTAGACARDRGSQASLSGAAAGRACLSRVAGDGGCRRGPSRSGVTRSRADGHRCGLLPRALHGGARRLRPNRSHRCPSFRRSSAARRDSPDRVPRWSRDGRRGIQQASQEPDRNRPGAARKWRPRRGVSRVGRHRVRKPLVRVDPRTRRTVAGDDLSAVGLDPGAADRHRGRARLSCRGTGAARDREPDVRNRRRRSGELRGCDARGTRDNGA